MENTSLGSRMYLCMNSRVVYFPVKHFCLYNKIKCTSTIHFIGYAYPLLNNWDLMVNGAYTNYSYAISPHKKHLPASKRRFAARTVLPERMFNKSDSISVTIAGEARSNSTTVSDKCLFTSKASLAKSSTCDSRVVQCFKQTSDSLARFECT